jgi:predicted MFS family arabinose efflux permease
MRGALDGSVGRLRRAARSGGAEESGLAPLLELTFFSSAGDALVTVALAGSQFLSVQPGEARTKVALYLLITMAPFALLAPVIGPALDRFPNGRRVALGLTMLARAALAITLARHIDSLYLYPLALGSLVLSRAFGIARSAVVPRVLPAESTLVKVNSRVTLTGVLGGLVVAPLGYGIAKLVGYPWMLRVGAGVFLIGVILAWQLPSFVDSAAGEKRAPSVAGAAVVPNTGRVHRILGELPAALRSAAALRALVGFLTLFLAFRAREDGLGLGGIALLGLAAGVGSAVGVFIGGRLKQVKPEVLLVIGLICAIVACAAGAVFYSTVTFILGALVVTMSGSMSKLGLDAVIQRDVAEDTRNSAFARSETALQLSWVVGGAFGLLPMPGWFGFTLGAIFVVVAFLGESSSLRRARLQRRNQRGGRIVSPQHFDQMEGLSQ